MQKSLTKDAITLSIEDVYFFIVNEALQFMRICLREEIIKCEGLKQKSICFAFYMYGN